MKKIEGFSGLAPRATSGNLKYCLWVDDRGALYVQITENITDAVTEAGTHSNLLFRVSDCIKDGGIVIPATLRGKDPETRVETEARNTNNRPFLRAVIEHLLPTSS